MIAEIGGELSINNDEFCCKNDELCVANDDLCISNDDFCTGIGEPAIWIAWDEEESISIWGKYTLPKQSEPTI